MCSMCNNLELPNATIMATVKHKLAKIVVTAWYYYTSSPFPELPKLLEIPLLYNKHFEVTNLFVCYFLFRKNKTAKFRWLWLGKVICCRNTLSLLLLSSQSYSGNNWIYVFCHCCNQKYTKSTPELRPRTTKFEVQTKHIYIQHPKMLLILML